MDYFSFFFNGLCLAGQSVLHMVFISRLTGWKLKAWQVAVYFFLIVALDGICVRFAPDGVLAVWAELFVLYGMNRLAPANRRAAAFIAAILAIYISQFSFGILNSVEVIWFPNLIGKPILYVLLVLATLTALFLCACCYRAVLKFLPLEKARRTPYIELLLFPNLFFFAAEVYIIHTSYSMIPVILSPWETGKHVLLLFLQMTGLAALFCTLYAYRRICRGFQVQSELISLTQAAAAQKIYVAEAKTRYERTKAFRHDIKNHLLVLSGLLNGGKSEEAGMYLRKLETASDSLSFPCRTGNPVVDILLSEKLGLAKANGIAAEVSLILSDLRGVDDFDLCVIFANALDNAVRACRFAGERKWIRITERRQGDFYVLGFENSCSEEDLPREGTGLSNIRTVAEKYHGAILTGKEGRRFSLDVLLNADVFTGGEEVLE
ncbi:MAG: GHKL domain-containing protein [Lachnospiraceae bacterium]|nr:GHKL domain-containing protein [Lachnospiraceae bacterium]